jgi:hypothetical protein
MGDYSSRFNYKYVYMFLLVVLIHVRFLYLNRERNIEPTKNEQLWTVNIHTEENGHVVQIDDDLPKIRHDSYIVVIKKFSQCRK